MASAALFIGWGQVARGREREALKVFSEGVEYWTGLQKRGEIESFEPVALEPHGGDLAGFCLLRGDREKLDRLRQNEEFLRMNARAGFCVDSFGVVGAYLGDQLQRLFAHYQNDTGDLTRG